METVEFKRQVDDFLKESIRKMRENSEPTFTLEEFKRAMQEKRRRAFV